MWAPWPIGPAGGGEPGAQWRVRRWTYFAGPWLVFLVQPLAALWHHGSWPARVAGTALLAAFAASYLFSVPRALLSGTWRARYLLCLRMLVLAGLTTWPMGADGLATLIYLGSACVILLPPRQALSAAVAFAVIVTGLPPAVQGWHTGTQWGGGLSVLGAAFIGYGFITLIRNNAALRAAREEVARLATEQERMRIARDLHDLLGHTLTTVTVKAGLARRLVYRDADRAEAELADVERLARQCLVDVRAAVAGYREVSLAVELATAREVLAAAGIAADLPHAVDQVPGELRELFGWAVREGVTNAVRHSRARRVRISVDERAVEVVDDGPGAPPPATTGGTGLAGLAERAARLGGRVEAGPLGAAPPWGDEPWQDEIPPVAAGASPAPRRGYRLRVEVPAGPPPVPAPEPAGVAP
jgi:two-component system sensor histidine kinase DesK